MPMMTFRITEVSTHITDRIGRQVADSLLSMMNLKQYFLEKNAVYYHADWLAVSNSSDGSANVNLQRDRCDITLDHALNPTDVHWPEAVTFRHLPAYGISKRDKNDQIPLFSDSVADVQLVETFEPFSMSLKFIMKFKEREMAEHAFTAIKSMTHAAGIHHTHDLSYAYPLSLDVCSALYLIYMQRSDYYDYDKRGQMSLDGKTDLAVKIPWLNYLYHNSGQDVSFEILKADVAAKQPERQLQVNRRTLGALGYLDFSQTKPQPVVEDEITDRYEVEFDYHIQFGRPASLQLFYPIIVENRLLPAPLVEEVDPTNLFDVEGVFQTKGFSAYLRATREYPRFTVKLPFYDDFCLPYQLPVVRWNFHPLLISAFTLDDGPSTVLDLVNGFGDVKLHPIVIELMKLHGRDLFGDTGLFALSVLSNDQPVDPDDLIISPELVLSCALTNKKRRYHLAISEATDLNHVDRKWWPYIGKYPWFFPLIITRSFEQLVQAGVIQVAPDPSLLYLIARCIASGELDVHIAKLLAAGHCTPEIYQATVGAGQFLAYLRSHLSPVSKRSLYSEMVDIGLAAGCLTRVPEDSYTGYLPGKGGSDAFGFPFRVLGGTIIVSR